MASSRSIESFVFMDFGTQRGNAEVLTEVCLRVAPRSVYLDPDAAEPTEKLSLNLIPNGFNLNTYNEINNFLNKLKKPVCLVSHNGNRFDFPILKRELLWLNVTLADDVLCADGLYSFYDILSRLDDGDVQPLVFEGSAVRERFYEGADPPGVSYRLGDIYERVVRVPPVVAHPAENDTLMKLRISRKLAKSFLAWTDQIQREFADVQPGELAPFQ